jgi:hypothetical protein
MNLNSKRSNKIMESIKKEKLDFSEIKIFQKRKAHEGAAQIRITEDGKINFSIHFRRKNADIFNKYEWVQLGYLERPHIFVLKMCPSREEEAYKLRASLPAHQCFVHFNLDVKKIHGLYLPNLEMFDKHPVICIKLKK